MHGVGKAGSSARVRGRGGRSVFAAVCVWVLLGSLLLPACSRPEPWESEDPTEALKVFLAALELRNLKVVWEFLLPEDRAALEARKAAFEAASGGEIEREAWDFISPGHVVSSAREYASLTVDESISDDEETVVVVELHDGRSFEMHMQRLDGRWYVDVPFEQVRSASPEAGPARGM